MEADKIPVPGHCYIIVTLTVASVEIIAITKIAMLCSDWAENPKIKKVFRLKISRDIHKTCDRFEETPNEKVSDLSKLTKPYFENQNVWEHPRSHGCAKLKTIP